ncbi:phosphoadenosine phosphosulfate reductase domain-containing protein [Pseudomonas japonica]|uniref:phosphoadenosine phosphosulfate reductase domain-containing protein n=1 Tax=Pseudomonas japonica TaxID=256466 RepID=UPI0015E2EA1A|nr:phosphoadenosine phosphosulfate reductase family protein [Pseudomonas japonica]MBA1243419.1 phosphoadenosine phosphosulfate reductase family protein [Pseudomonas japonica]MBA1290532.1 phosphoadenosine phosphosulfate reductase family protein [Pseudomonas japonica]
MNPYVLRGKTVLSFSGGRTSAYMLRQVLDANYDRGDLLVLFANTGKEYPATLEFVRECASHWDVPITWLEYREDELGFAVVDFDTASREGEPFEAVIRKRKYLPNPVTRFCTVELKIRVIHKYLRHLGLSTEDEPVDMMTGIRGDEPRRVTKIRNRGSTSESKHATMVLPLADAGVSVHDASAFWLAQTFDLRLPTVNGRTLEGNCDLCFLKPLNQVYSIIASDRGRGEWWARQEAATRSAGMFAGDGARFRKDRPSYQQMIDYSEIQYDLFAEADEAIDCFCGD